MKLKITIISLFLTLCTNIFAEDKVTVAILDLVPKGVPGNVSNLVSNIIRSEFVNIGNFMVVERSQMNAILKEQGLQMTGCTDSACAVEFGKLLSARRIVVGEITKMKKSLIITARYVDVASGESLFSSRRKTDSIDNIDSVTSELAEELANRIVSGDKEIITPKTVSGYYLRSMVPGWGQFYGENSYKGILFAGCFTAAAALAGASVYNYYDKKSKYDGLNREDSAASMKEKRDNFDKSAMYVNISIGLVGAVYIMNWIDSIFLSRSDFDKAIAMEESGSNGLFLQF